MTENNRHNPYKDRRCQMVKTIRKKYGFKDERVLDVMLQVPRHEFVPKKYWNIAYDDYPVDIGYGQTMSQPYTVAKMTQLATEIRNSKSEIRKNLQITNAKLKRITQIYERDKEILNTKYFIRNTCVLEIGTGSGYQAAVLSYFFNKVYTVEIISELSHLAGNNLSRLGYRNVFVRTGSGEWGWKEHSLYDAIIITAGVENVPEELFKQLKVGGVLVAPLGKGRDKTMVRITKKRGLTVSDINNPTSPRLRRAREEFGTFHFVPFVK